MNKDIKDRILKLEKDVNECGEAIRETTGNVLKVVQKILDHFGNEPPKNLNKMSTKILDNFESVLSQQKILIKITSQLFETTEKIHRILG